MGVVFSEDGKRFVGGMCRAARCADFRNFFAIFGAHCRFLSETNVLFVVFLGLLYTVYNCFRVGRAYIFRYRYIVQ